MKINNLIIGLIIIGILVLVSACTQKITCNKPYILVGDNCCLDKDDNGICDSDETEKEAVKEVISCSDECTVDICRDYEYVTCSLADDGCYDAVNEGKIVG